MLKGAHVRISRIKTSTPGELPVSYWLLAVLTEAIEPGKPMTALRYARAARDPHEAPDGVQAPGLFTSSPVLVIHKPREDGTVTVQTHNSTYEVTPLAAPDSDAAALLHAGIEYIAGAEGTTT